jgi:hypothetical protein
MKLNVLIFGLLVSGFWVLSSCSDTEPNPTNNNTQGTFTGFAVDDITVSHIKGTDPCPTEGKEKIVVRCYNTPTYSDCQADSFAITKPNSGLNTIIPGVVGQSANLPQDGSNLEILVQFTCDVEESFYHAYDLVFYKDGAEVATERVEVDVFVN